jgi:hypothetical protein
MNVSPVNAAAWFKSPHPPLDHQRRFRPKAVRHREPTEWWARQRLVLTTWVFCPLRVSVLGALSALASCWAPDGMEIVCCREMVPFIIK